MLSICTVKKLDVFAPHESRPSIMSASPIGHNSSDAPLHHKPASIGAVLQVRAVVFDYGMVLTGPPDPQAYAEMIRITGLSAERFHDLYWADRPAYDAGHLTGIEYWQKFDRDAGLNLPQRLLEELNLWDARYWTTESPAMLAWQLALKQRGIKTAILSNMGDNVRSHIEREFKWFFRFDVLVWSYELKIVKPDPAIYRYVLGKLGTAPQETLFIDDRQVNVDGANALGMIGVTFSTAEALRSDLAAMGFDSALPLP